MAIHHDVVIDGNTYRMFEDDGLELVKNDLLAAARSGGAFVTMSRGATESLEVLITACTPIRIDHTWDPADPRGGEVTEPPADDPDWWF
jgi:hypothetical protein